jgi:uncharacterized delta-60 repeat protein
VITPISGASDHLFDLVVQPDGKLVAAGWSFQGGGPHLALARYNHDGSLDPSFDGDGIVLASFRSAGAHLVLQRDGKLLVAGLGSVTRFNPDGSLDRSFGESGSSRSGSVDPVKAVTQPDGKILVIGTVLSGSDTGDFGVARLTAGGRLDTTYGRGGSVVTAFSSGSDDQALDGVLLPDGKLVVSGMSNATPRARGRGSASSRRSTSSSAAVGADDRRELMALCARRKQADDRVPQPHARRPSIWPRAAEPAAA